jgi:hypothetical protein
MKKIEFTEPIEDLSNRLSEKHKNAKNDNPVSEILSRGLVCSDLTTSHREKPLDILFLGLNPSYIGADNKTFDKYDPTDKETYPRYFGAFHRLTEEIEGKHFDGKINWTQMDILNVRETDSNKILNLMQHKDWVEALALNLVKNMKCIEKLQPKLIVVCNAKAAMFTGIEAFPEDKPMDNIWMGYKFEFVKTFGVHKVVNLHPESIVHRRDDKGQIIEQFPTELNDTSFIFTSTLTYMSKYVKESLAWQIGRVLKEVKLDSGLNDTK